MDCKEADKLMMKYMDSVMTEAEALLLGTHIESCANCREAFAIYDMMMDDFSDLELMEAPEGFELEVMEKINELPTVSEKIMNNMDNANNLVWGTFSVLLGIATLITMNRDLILKYMISNETLNPYAQMVTENIEYFQTIFTNIETSFYAMLTVFNTYIAEGKYFILVVFAVLIAVQVYIYRKEKVDA